MKGTGSPKRSIARNPGDSFHFSHPAPNGGPDSSILIEALNSEKFVARRSRNRRIGKLLKKLELTEGRCTGIQKIRAAMEKNGSAPPRFSTDEGRTFFMAEQAGHRWVRARPSDEALAGCLAECQPELDAGDGSEECLVVVFDALDEVRLSEEEVDVVRLLDLEGLDFHGSFLFSWLTGTDPKPLHLAVRGAAGVVIFSPPAGGGLGPCLNHSMMLLNGSMLFSSALMSGQ